ncbi:MAG TPA: hypothetical protein VMS94_03810 [Acidobacteriota bacterium]|nr:hypothetical protein [Acidobacteriota bacterium]
MAIPVTYLILFASLIAVISATYSFAIVKISSRGALLKASVAKQNMLALDDAVHSVAWNLGASSTVYMDDCGDDFQILPTAKSLTINFTDSYTFNDVVFNSSIGETFYKLESSEADYNGLFIRGDKRAIINQSTSTMTQLYYLTGKDAEELTLSYCPSAAATLIGTKDGKASNLIRIYIINLNSSQNLILTGKFNLKTTDVSITTATRQYEFNSSFSSLALKAILDETSSTVQLPIVGNSEGAVVNLEIVVCNIKIQTVGA